MLILGEIDGGGPLPAVSIANSNVPSRIRGRVVRLIGNIHSTRPSRNRGSGSLRQYPPYVETSQTVIEHYTQGRVKRDASQVYTALAKMASAYNCAD